MTTKEVATAAPTSERLYGYDRWEVQDALRTLTRAQEIVNDTKLFKAVQKYAGDEAKRMNTVSSGFAGLRKLTHKR